MQEHDRGISRRQLLKLTGAVAGAAALPGLLGVCGRGGNGGATGGLLRVGTSTSAPESTNPFVSVQSIEEALYDLIYPQLTRYDNALNYAPDFATSWEVSDDGRNWTFTTRDGARWSDGAPLTAEDAAWTLSTMRRFADGPTSAFATNVEGIEDVRADGPTTLVVRYRRPTAGVLEALAVPLLPRHVWESKLGDDGKGLQSFANPAPVVSGGPFVLREFDKGTRTILDRNDRYFAERPKVDRVGIQYFANNDAMVSGLRSGEIDVIDRLPPELADTVRDAGSEVKRQPMTRFVDLYFNSNPDKPRHRELLEPKVRESLDHAIDRNRIVEVAYAGYALPGDSVIPPVAERWRRPGAAPTPFDLERANALLEEAGYTRGARGTRVANGEPMRYEVIFADEMRGAGDRAYSIIRSDWAKIGIELSRRVLDSSAAFEATIAPDGKYRDFDIGFWSWTVTGDPRLSLYLTTCASRDDEYGDTGACDKDYDRLYERQLRTPDDGERARIVHEMDAMLARDRPYLVIVYPDLLAAVSTRWTGLDPAPNDNFTALDRRTLTTIQAAG